jgi:catechol 2,3-dioxygenase-like lactoylglutathione lyase family enzyme
MRELASPSGFAFAGLSPELLVSDLARSLEFWRDLCGFSIAYERAEERFAYLDRGGLQVMLKELGSPMCTWMKCDLERPFGRGVNFQFRIGDVDRVAAKFVAAD